MIKVELNRAYMLLNLGSTTLISAKANDVENAMAASWVCPLDYDKVSAVIDSGSFTSTLIKSSEYFAVQVPVVAQARLVSRLGSSINSRHKNPNKMEGVELFYVDGYDVPLVKGCAGWLICKKLNEPENERKFDLYMGEVVAAYADEMIFDGRRWLFDRADDSLRTLHYAAGGQYYADGKSIIID